MKIGRLEWDDINLEHIAGKHGLSPGEVEDICFGSHWVCPARHNRKAMYEKTSTGKYLMIVLERLRNNVFRVITAREMSLKEKREYRAVIG